MKRKNDSKFTIELLKENHPIKPFDCEDDDCLIPHPKRHLKSVPAVKIGRLAIDKTYKGMGLGRLIIRNLIADCVKLNQQIACRLITVDAYKDALPFY